MDYINEANDEDGGRDPLPRDEDDGRAGRCCRMKSLPI